MSACFHGLTAYRLRLALRRRVVVPKPGEQTEAIPSVPRLFVVPNPSPANAHFTVRDQAAWYDRLAAFLERVPTPTRP